MFVSLSDGSRDTVRLLRLLRGLNAVTRAPASPSQGAVRQSPNLSPSSPVAMTPGLIALRMETRPPGPPCGDLGLGEGVPASAPLFSLLMQGGAWISWPAPCPRS